jgi:hypothetical protein
MKGVTHACKTIFVMVQGAVAEVLGHSGRRRLWRSEATNPGFDAPGGDHAMEKNSMAGAAPSALVAREDIVRLILDGTGVKLRLDRKATSLSLLVGLGIRRGSSPMLAGA